MCKTCEVAEFAGELARLHTSSDGIGDELTIPIERSTAMTRAAITIVGRTRA